MGVEACVRGDVDAQGEFLDLCDCQRDAIQGDAASGDDEGGCFRRDADF